MTTQSASGERWRPDDQLLAELVRRVVEAVRPIRIILFGSAARGETGPDSDLDILLVMPDGTHRRQTAQEAHKSLRGLGVPKDVIAVTGATFGSTQAILRLF